MFLCLLVFLISFLFSSFGMGGGLFYMPLFLLFVEDHFTASFLSFFCVFMTSAGAMLAYCRKGFIDWRLVRHLGLPLVGMIFLSAFFVLKLPLIMIKGIFGWTLVWAGLSMIFPRINRSFFARISADCSKRFPDKEYAFAPWLLSPLTSIIGFLAGIAGVAGGVFEIPLMASVLRVSAHTAVATSSAIIFFASCLGVVGRLIRLPRLCQMDAGLFIALLLCSFSGAQFGPRFSIRMKPERFKKVCGVFILGLGVSALFKVGVQVFS